DNCGGTVTTTLTNTSVAGTDCSWTVTYTFSVSDACGNTLAGRTYSNTGGDKTAPVIICPANVTVSSGASTLPAATGTATATDNCSGILIITYSDVTTSCLDGNYIISRTWRATDVCNNSASCTQTITVNDCTTDCEAPSVFTMDSISAAEAQICFNSIPGAQGYIVAWRTIPQTDWIISTVIAPDTCLIFTNHFPDVYEIEIATICANGDTSAFGPVYTYETFRSCTKPQNPYTSGITATKATLNWSAVIDADKYVVNYRQTGTTVWTKKTLSKTFLTVKNLQPSTQYEWKVQSKCIGATRSVGGKFTPLQYFTTLSLKAEQSISSVEITGVQIYPNPASQQFTYGFDADGAGTYSIAIENVLGQIIYSALQKSYSGNVKQQVDLGNVPEGMYLFHLIIDGKEYSKRLEVQHSY
ncbi:MAG: T9SS type A sorting domain-containing protein, partial [Chitinophagales bacterium]